MIDGWDVSVEVRREGNTAGTYDVYYFSPARKRFRSRAEVARSLGLTPAPSRKGAGPKLKALGGAGGGGAGGFGGAGHGGGRFHAVPLNELRRLQRLAPRLQRALGDVAAAVAARPKYPVDDARLALEPPPRVALAPFPPAEAHDCLALADDAALCGRRAADAPLHARGAARVERLSLIHISEPTRPY